MRRLWKQDSAGLPSTFIAMAKLGVTALDRLPSRDDDRICKGKAEIIVPLPGWNSCGTGTGEAHDVLFLSSGGFATQSNARSSSPRRA
jgi:hypothetical protein